jgi:hypothetical protein
MSKNFQAPRHAGAYPDRHLDCQCAIEDALITVIDYAEAAGWNTGEITSAIIELADNIAMQQASTDEVRKIIDEIRLRHDLK